MAARGAIVAAARAPLASGRMALTPRALLRAAVGCAAVFVALLLVAYGVDGARRLDASALQGFLGLQRPSVTPLTDRLTSLGDPLKVGLLGGALALLALARGRPRSGLFVIVLLSLTSVSSQVLKAVLAYPRYEGTIDGAHISPAAFPSGHATASMSLAICLVVVMPSRLRPAAAVVGTGLALAVSFSIMSLGWHFPSDIAGGYLLATGWALVLLAGLRWAEARYPERTWRTGLAATTRSAVEGLAAVGLVTVLAGAAFAVVAVVAAVLSFRLPDVMTYAEDHTAFVAVAVAIATGAAALLGGVAGALARRG